MPWARYVTCTGSVENLAPRSWPSQQLFSTQLFSTFSINYFRSQLFSIYAEVHSRHSRPGGQVAGFEVQDDVVFAATGGVVPRPDIAFRFLEKHGGLWH